MKPTGWTPPGDKVENDKEQKRREAARKRPIRPPDPSVIGGPKSQQSPTESSQKYSGGLLKSGEGEHFERGRQRMNSYRGIDAMPHSSENLQEKLQSARLGADKQRAVKKSGCVGVLLLAAALPLAAVAIALFR